MPDLPDRAQQIRLSHATLIHQVVRACQNTNDKGELAPMLDAALANGWDTLVEAIHQILTGRRDESLFAGLDSEDKVIIQSILGGLLNPTSLPEINQTANPSMAAPGLALMINAAKRGDTDALQSIGFMADQMSHTEGDMRHLGAIMRRLVGGEDDPDTLCKGMGPSGEQLVLNLIDELNKLRLQ